MYAFSTGDYGETLIFSIFCSKPLTWSVILVVYLSLLLYTINSLGCPLFWGLLQSLGCNLPSLACIMAFITCSHMSAWPFCNNLALLGSLFWRLLRSLVCNLPSLACLMSFITCSHMSACSFWNDLALVWTGRYVVYKLLQLHTPPTFYLLGVESLFFPFVGIDLVRRKIRPLENALWVVCAIVVTGMCPVKKVLSYVIIVQIYVEYKLLFMYMLNTEYFFGILYSFFPCVGIDMEKGTIKSLKNALYKVCTCVVACVCMCVYSGQQGWGDGRGFRPMPAAGMPLGLASSIVHIRIVYCLLCFVLMGVRMMVGVISHLEVCVFDMLVLLCLMIQLWAVQPVLGAVLISGICSDICAFHWNLAVGQRLLILRQFLDWHWLSAVFVQGRLYLS